MSLVKTKCYKILSKNLSPKLTTLNNKDNILFFKEKKIVD
ncbi:hypothetical protein CHFL109739_01750 [Chryseobacterium flavum]